MHKISLKDWVVLLTVVPTTVICLLVASYFSYGRYVELNEFLSLRSQSIIEPLAIASVEPIINKDREKLRNLIGFAHRSHSSIVKSIAVFTLDNQVLVTSAYHGDTNIMRLKAGENIPKFTTKEELDDFFIFRSPIINENNDIKGFNQDSYQQNSQIVVGYIAMQIDRNQARFAQQSQMLISFSIVLLGSLISAILSFRLIKNVTRPVATMVQAVDRIREGKLESRVSGQLIGELNFLKNGINAMAQSLGDFHDEMQRSIDQATIDLRESLEQFEIQNVELDISKRKAQDANRVKSEFLANMSHELRTPLNGVIGFTRQILKSPLSETQRDYLQTIERSANHLLEIINDILDFSKLDADKMVIESIPFTLRESIEETLTLLATSAHAKDIELSLRIAQHLPDSLVGDAMRIKQVMLNLANNAIKFTEKGSVTIDVDGNQIDAQTAVFKITVTDTGIGMNNEQQSTIFEAFGQADKSITRLYGGTGLGLVISQRLAEEMNGDIGFISEEKQGSTFWFTFQCGINPIPLTAINTNQDLVKKHVLYYEPLTHSRVATCEIMEHWQMQVTTVTSLDNLTRALSKKQHYDFVLISHPVTPSNLNELKALISAIKPRVDAVHLAINSISPSLQETLLASGAKSCLSKPITPSRLNKAFLTPQSTESQLNEELNQQKISVKVLAVDDNEANLKLIKALLLEQVTEVIVAKNGREAVELCKNEIFSLIFMDIQMPIMDGITALELIKKNSLNDKTAIIAVTAHVLTGEKEKLMQQGFSAYMTKPIDESMLRHTLYEYCDLTLNSTIVVDKVIAEQQIQILASDQTLAKQNDVIDWSLALQRTGYKSDLAKDMLEGLVNSLAETQQNIDEAIVAQDIDKLKALIHKLNGACCYTGVPRLGKVSQQIETELKRGKSIQELEPELLELSEHIAQVLHQAPELLETL